MHTRILRFAPSPNGYLHLGHAFSALLNHDMARELGGRLLLRIEDIDAQRSRSEFEAALYEDLAWLGISWAEPVRRQSEHFADYEAALRKLDALGLLYPGFESRSEIAASNSDRDRWASISSMRSSRRPPSSRAMSWLSRAEKAWPRCKYPFGLGAKRRIRVCIETLPTLRPRTSVA